MQHINRARRAAGALVLGLGLAATTAACGDGGSEEPTTQQLSDSKHNDADVDFATGMIPHHAQALSMVDMTRDRKLSAKAQALVDGIREAQAPEIETMVDWLTEWGEEVPATMRDHVNAGHGDHDMGDSMEHTEEDMPGMMSAEDMQALEDASDADFEAMWMEMMIEHHEGAIEMAETESDDGQYRPAVELADAIIEAQEAEIERMEKLVG